MKKSCVLHNKKVSRQRNRRLKQRQRSLRRWLARTAKARQQVAALFVAREPAPVSGRGFYRGGPGPRRRSPTVERLLWSGNVEYRVFPPGFGGQPLRKQRPVAITEPSSRPPALTPSLLVERIIVCSQADFLWDYRRLCLLSSRVSVGWGLLPEAGALRVITPAPEPERLSSDPQRAGGQAGSGSFALAGLPERLWPLETHAPLRSRFSWWAPSASGAGGHPGKPTVIASKGAEKSAVGDSAPGVEQPPSRRIHKVLITREYPRESTRSNRAARHLRETRGIGKWYRLYKKCSSWKRLSGTKNLGNPRGAIGRAHGRLPAASEAMLKLSAAAGPCQRRLRGRPLWCGDPPSLLPEIQTANSTGGHSDHSTLHPPAVLPYPVGSHEALLAQRQAPAISAHCDGLNQGDHCTAVEITPDLLKLCRSMAEGLASLRAIGWSDCSGDRAHRRGQR